jgi:hypothetical protein
VAPEGAVVVPEVVVWIVRKDADGCSRCLFHGVLPFGFAPGIDSMKKPPAPSGAAVHYWPWRFFVVRVFRPAHRLDFSQASHRGIFSNSSVGTLRLTPQEFLMLILEYDKSRPLPSRDCVIRNYEKKF